MLGTLQELAARVGGRVVGDPDLVIERVTAVDETEPGALTFATDERYLAAALASKAAAVLSTRASRRRRPAKPLLIVRERALGALAAARVAAPADAASGPFRHPTAAIDPASGDRGRRVSSARTPSSAPAPASARAASIDAGAYVGRGRRRSATSTLAAPARDVSWSAASSATAWCCTPGCVIGSDGFGWAFVDGALERIPQVGNVVLDDDVEIGANTCIDRGQTGSTRIGAGTKIDNLVQIGHNCRIGKHSAFAALSGLAGSTEVGDYIKVARAGRFARPHDGRFARHDRRAIRRVGRRPRRRDRLAAIRRTTTARSCAERSSFRKLPKLFDRVDALERERAPRTAARLNAKRRCARALDFDGIGLHTGAAARRLSPRPTPEAACVLARWRCHVPGDRRLRRRHLRATVLGHDGRDGFDHRAPALRALRDGRRQRRDRGRRPRDSGVRRQLDDLRRRHRGGGLAVAAGRRATLAARRARLPAPTATGCCDLPGAERFAFEFVADFPRADRYAVSSTARSSRELYRAEIAPARTFGYLHEVEALARAGTGAGRVARTTRSSSPPTGRCSRCAGPTKSVRHKVLDLIGDFALLGLGRSARSSRSRAATSCTRARRANCARAYRRLARER